MIANIQSDRLRKYLKLSAELYGDVQMSEESTYPEWNMQKCPEIYGVIRKWPKTSSQAISALISDCQYMVLKWHITILAIVKFRINYTR